MLIDWVSIADVGARKQDANAEYGAQRLDVIYRLVKLMSLPSTNWCLYRRRTGVFIVDELMLIELM